MSTTASFPRQNCRSFLRSFASILLAVVLCPWPAEASSVRLTEQEIVIPTYLLGDPEPNPMFYFGGNSQGAAGRVYPYPLYDSLTNVKSNKTYHAVYLENEYLRICILPEVGGRLLEAVDKSDGYNFIYRQHVIKPALIGLIGAWMSGGIEWNIPHHHRATSFLPVQYHLQSNADGSKTIWVGELEVRQRMRWAVGYTLRPDKSYLECSVRILNRTPVANTMLCFANVAVSVNSSYQVIFPPATQYVTYHGKREFASWPIASGNYAGADFGRGTDVSWYSNHFNANSMFAWNYEDDFFAGYDHGKEAGIISVADHHFIPGKKFWTWGNGPRGHMWDKILTDEDGPYIELMTGAYSDNQPDYSWLQPYETKSFQMFWYPFREIGGVKKANLDAAVNLEVTKPGAAKIGFCATSAHRSAEVLVTAGHDVLLRQNVAISPGKPFLKQISFPQGRDEHDLRATLSDGDQELVSYSPVRRTPMEKPKPVVPPPPPKDIKTAEELYLAGQRVAQFHSPGMDAEAYWQEGLRRDPGDSRTHTALGIQRLKEARFEEAEEHFHKALERLSFNYTAPKDGEPYYYLGLTLRAQGQTKAAEDAFAKATWSEAWRGPGYFALAEIATGRGNFSAALDDLDRALSANALNPRALALKAALLRHTGHSTEALALLDSAEQSTDPLDVRLLTERWLAGDKRADEELNRNLREHPATGLETAAEFDDAGLRQDATDILTLLTKSAQNPARVSPLAYYYLAHFASLRGDDTQAASFRTLAQEQPPGYVFPFQWEFVPVLREAMAANPRDARAPYYLGNLLFDSQPAEAVKLWKQSEALDSSFAIVHRNLAAAYLHQKPERDSAGAIAELEQAVNCNVKYALHFTELDEAYAAAGVSPEKRLALLEHNQATVLQRDDTLCREISLKVFAGKYDDAIQLMGSRKFGVWEGGSLAVADDWMNAHLARGRQKLSAGKAAAALADFQAARTIPDNLPSDQGGDGREAELTYWIGAAYSAIGDKAKAAENWQESEKATRHGRSGRVTARQVQAYYRALAQRRLGETAEAESALRGLLETAQGAPADAKEPTALSHYLAGLGHLGLGETDKAKAQFELALQSVPDSLGPKVELAQLHEEPSACSREE
ncbi:MAG: DUF5107 domain-containing protein [Limisphaerales bacterium]